MKSNAIVNSILVIVGFLLAFGAGYLFLGKESPEPEAVPEEQAETETTEESAEDLASMVPDEAMVLSRNGCLSCHSVESIGAPGGDIGPDLSRSFPEMKEKHGKELNDFLIEPTSAVMATIIADKPLKDDEREQIVAILKEASEKHNSSDADADDE
ncbi:MAG TPA: cytochrome C [Pseudogracilibacillus sp.]|nr:cytochrome C [Pseudogracilibacillus sp.]